MKKMKDVFYDMNDILVAIIIIIIAAFVIGTNMNDILNYPSKIAEQIKVPEEKPVTHYAEDPANTTDSGISQNEQNGNVDSENSSNEEPSQSNDNGNGEVEKYAVYIEYGATADKVADLIISVGLMETRQEFYDAMKAANAENKLKAGNFIIPSDATPAEVINILTN